MSYSKHTKTSTKTTEATIQTTYNAASIAKAELKQLPRINGPFKWLEGHNC
jgi:hypothetical protein